MRTKAVFLLGGAVGYVLGTRAGREQFEKIRSSAQTVWQNPKVQDTVSGAQARISEKAPDLKDKVSGAVKSVRGGRDEDQDVWASDDEPYSAGGELTNDGTRPSGPTGLS